MPDPGSARSFWLQEALANDPGEPCPPLDAHVVADVCIVGGGFAGLWTAVRLTERDPSLRIALVEQDIVGGGASGRNGGFFSSSWWDLGVLIGLFGEA
jgi:heterodisulfide reductase subunit A-like polyferredoxin